MRGSLAVHTALLERGIQHEIFRLDRPSRTLDHAARAQGLALREVARVTIFETPRGPFAAIAPADLEPNASAIANIVGSSDVRRATPGAASRHTGFLAEWIPPLGYRKAIAVVIDPRVLDNEVVYTAGGDAGVLLKMRSEDLQDVTRGVLAELAAERLSEVIDVTTAADDVTVP